MLLRWLPPAFGSPGSTAIVYFVAITSRSRRPLAKSPTNRSEVPPVYWLAVSTKLPPRST